jgi:hypothetical protein
MIREALPEYSGRAICAITGAIHGVQWFASGLPEMSSPGESNENAADQYRERVYGICP